jgi:Fe-S cluster assembly protein SufD
VRFVNKAEASAHHARLGVHVKAGVKATLFESYEGAGDGYFSNVLIEIFLEPGASLERIAVLDDAPDSISVSTAEVFLAPLARFGQTIVADGAKRQRAETRVRHPGAGAAVRLDGVYLLADRRHADITTVVTHSGMDGTTDQLTKGVVRDQGRGVFQGRIVVKPGADKTDARMGHHALVLSDRAEVDAKPELEIFADDVACAHGNTVGALDEEALFYAEQRGIPEDAAKAMLTEAFVGEVVDRIEHEGARDVVRAWVAERLQ